MSEKPILFNGEMVRAILDGRKTQTRRVIKPQPFVCNGAYQFSHNKYTEEHHCYADIDQEGEDQFIEFLSSICPYGAVGDRLWVREAFSFFEYTTTGRDVISYKADDGEKDFPNEPNLFDGLKIHQFDKNYPSIFLPRWASRITLEITNIRVERVQDTCKQDIIAEGVDFTEGEYYNLKDSFGGPEDEFRGWMKKNLAQKFSQLWDSINEKRGYGWDKNPWVWVVEFKLQEQGK